MENVDVCVCVAEPWKPLTACSWLLVACNIEQVNSDWRQKP